MKPLEPYTRTKLIYDSVSWLDKGIITSFFISWIFLWSPAAAIADESSKLGFVIRDWFTAVYDTKFADECPTGLVIANDEIWWRNISNEDRARLTENGLLQTIARKPAAVHRGPNGEDVCLNPSVVKDKPMKIIAGKYSYGANLDGTLDGGATPKTCTHKKFIGLDGTLGVDNQLYRLMGCTPGWRPGGLTELNAHEGRGTSGLGMVLIEITGVTDPRNSDDVTVTFYRSIDQFAFDGGGRPLPHSSYNIDAVDGKPYYSDSLKGSIKDGVLATVRGNVRLPFYGNYNFISNVIRDMALTLEIAPDGATAEGMVTGYYDLDELLYYANGISGHASAADNCPSMNDMGERLADGYPDPKTGVCTHISSAFKVGAIAAFVIHPVNGGEKDEEEQRTAQR